MVRDMRGKNSEAGAAREEREVCVCGEEHAGGCDTKTERII